MRARPVAIEGARIVDFEGASLVVESPVVGRVLVPSEMIDDDSEIWRVGEAGTLLVEGAWAKQRGIKGKRLSRTATAAARPSAPVELVRKAAVEAPSVLVARLVRVPDEVLVRDRERRKNKRKKSWKQEPEVMPDVPAVGPYYDWRQQARIQRLWDEIQSGVPSDRKKGTWERQQELILQTYYAGWTWERLLERMRQGNLGSVPPDPGSERTWRRTHAWEAILRSRKRKEEREGK